MRNVGCKRDIDCAGEGVEMIIIKRVSDKNKS